MTDPESPKMGRPTECTPEVTRKVAEALGVGSSLRVAAQFAGISKESVRVWLLRGEAGEEPYAAFWAAVQMARAGVQVDLARTVLDAAKGDPRLALRMLTLLPGTEWGQVERHEMSGPGGRPLPPQGIGADDLARRLDALAARAAARDAPRGAGGGTGGA